MKNKLRYIYVSRVRAPRGDGTYYPVLTFRDFVDSIGDAAILHDAHVKSHMLIVGETITLIDA